uniref:PGG domain-containing protein n=1 Tax=Quercus lobata TaxID=97700 RepID=A0A7N2L5V0_QUELO
MPSCPVLSCSAPASMTVHLLARLAHLALKILEEDKSLAYARDTNGETALHVLARKPSTIGNKSDLGIWKRSINPLEKIVPPSYIKMKNSKNQTPKELFAEEHKLLKEGEKWMKSTATSCMLVATFIATVEFAAIITVPGGENNNTGVPIFLREKWFLIFVISDAIALFSSSASIIMFLSILTSRYAENDFLISLPTRLMFGISTLFISIATMVLASLYWSHLSDP